MVSTRSNSAPAVLLLQREHTLAAPAATALLLVPLPVLLLTRRAAVVRSTAAATQARVPTHQTLLCETCMVSATRGVACLVNGQAAQQQAQLL